MLINDVVCPFCGCLCDDLDVEVEGDRIVRIDNACTLGSKTMPRSTASDEVAVRTTSPELFFTFTRAPSSMPSIIRSTGCIMQTDAAVAYSGLSFRSTDSPWGTVRPVFMSILI
ncbi:MAG: hypothetical protein NTW33_07390, partial [Methanoregula sp.]|nr:hypothetical protein [Methanoregula sp.]